MKIQHTFRQLKSSVSAKRYIYCVLVMFIATSLSSCKKFLDQTSPNDVAQENMFQDANSLESARIGMYNTLQNVYYYGGYFPLMVDAYSDNGATGGYDSPDVNELGDKTLTSANIYVQNTWIAIYNTIYTANQILANVDAIDDPTLSDKIRNDIKGEALAIRALAHFDLLRMFGEHWNLASEYGIPVVKQVVEPTTFIGRSSVAESYDAITGDLVEAQSLIQNDDYRSDPAAFKGAMFMTLNAVNALLARVYLYKKDFTQADSYATEVIDAGYASLLEAGSFNQIYTSKLSAEAIFELVFNGQDRSQYNAATYARPDALRSEVLFLAAEDLRFFFESRPDDPRGALVDFVNNDLSIEPDGRTQKYRGEDFQDNDALVIRIAEMYLIRAEARGLQGGGLDDLNLIRENRGLPAYATDDFDVPGLYELALAEERRAELNFEGHRYFDLARLQKVQETLGEEVLPVFPIPLREVTATNGVITQYPGY
ncbi:MAG: RagB/SusD family nutrient uptake outer membrane protein [Chitinophagaceae bacterium]|nr:RagB/SusD family nutrient uptake outer membrane protein [Chitinophagaceae bacterium]